MFLAFVSRAKITRGLSAHVQTEIAVRSINKSLLVVKIAKFVNWVTIRVRQNSRSCILHERQSPSPEWVRLGFLFRDHQAGF